MSRVEEWFLAQGSMGFTMDPDQAQKSKNGNPIACPGALNQTWRKHFAQDKERREVIWNLMLDEMEKFYELSDRPDDHDAHERAQLCLSAVDAFKRSLAALIYGVVNDDSCKAVMREANHRYDQE